MQTKSKHPGTGDFGFVDLWFIVFGLFVIGFPGRDRPFRRFCHPKKEPVSRLEILRQ